MPKARKDLLQEWEELLTAVRETERDLGPVAPYYEALAGEHTQALVFKSLRDSLEASTANASRRLDQTLDRGQRAAVKLRAFIRSVLGLQSEGLRRYGMKPYRGRLRELSNRGRRRTRSVRA
ncbi:MAG TPA: hypothetical protein VF789_04195 [Thermoanaerobaculia bacterium]